MRFLKKTAALLLAVMLFMTLLPTAFAASTETTPVATSGEAALPVSEEINKDTAGSESSGDTQEGTEQSGTTKLGYFSAYTGLDTQVDYSDLKLQLAMVNGLNQYEYTQESWALLQTKYENGKTALESTSQETVDAAEKQIGDAIDALVKMDYSALEDALEEVEDLIEENPGLHDVWIRLNAAAEEHKPLLTSGDQEAVDAAAAALNELLTERLQYADSQKEPEIIVQEVEVEVPPSDDYCNIPMHRTWPVLFFGSLALNVVLVGIIVYILIRKKNTTDDMPLVDYDIDDDMDDEMY